MSEERKCVCGHLESEHRDRPSKISMDFNGNPFDDWRCHCDCHRFREAVEWPTSEGWWWSDYFQMVQAADWGDDIRICYHASWNSEGMLSHIYSMPFRFTQAEPNPFASQPTDKGTKP